MKRNRHLFYVLGLITVIMMIAGSTSVMLPFVDAQNLAQSPAPTLVPPTPIPPVDGGETEMILGESGLARIQNTGRLRVGILYNAPPFGELNIRDEHVGFDADLARALGETWGVEVRFRQVTRQTAEEMLRDQDVDLLIAAIVHRRELDSRYEFSQTYYLGSQSMMVRVDDGAASPRDLGGRRVGYVIGTASEDAIADWSARNGTPFTTSESLTLDKLYGALVNNQVDAIVASIQDLNGLAAARPDATRILEEPLAPEPYAVVMQRGDVPLRNLVNRTLQYLKREGKLNDLGQTHFLTDAYSDLMVWENVGNEAPKPADFDASVTFPAQFVVPRLQSERQLRVAGIAAASDPSADLPESQQRLDTFHRGLIQALASRWGVEVVFTPASPEEAINLVASGQADLAISVVPDWVWADRVDFTGTVMARGLRLMVPINSGIIDLRNEIGGFWIAYPTNNREYQDIMIREGERLGVLVKPLPVREQDMAFAILEERNADAAMADAVQLLPYLQTNGQDFLITDRWYSRTFESFAVPRNDSDFRLLVEYTLQELVRDGTLEALLNPVSLPNSLPRFDVWPGNGNTFGFNITQ